jgi:hypothetical protein
MAPVQAQTPETMHGYHDPPDHCHRSAARCRRWLVRARALVLTAQPSGADRPSRASASPRVPQLGIYAQGFGAAQAGMPLLTQGGPGRQRCISGGAWTRLGVRGHGGGSDGSPEKTIAPCGLGRRGRGYRCSGRMARAARNQSRCPEPYARLRVAYGSSSDNTTL